LGTSCRATARGRGVDHHAVAGIQALAISSFYQSLLGRNLDDAGRNFWVNSGQNLADIRMGIEASDEFFKRS